jgi:hypothetical protein
MVIFLFCRLISPKIPIQLADLAPGNSLLHKKVQVARTHTCRQTRQVVSQQVARWPFLVGCLSIVKMLD